MKTLEEIEEAQAEYVKSAGRAKRLANTAKRDEPVKKASKKAQSA